jgi:hypothetical protein
MNVEFNFFKTSMPETRKADFYLGCLDSSVFVDFNISNDNLIYLVRISFDGYGCCNLYDNAESLNVTDSQEFLKEIEKEILNQETIGSLVKQIVKMNQDLIWKDALEEYGLL